MHPHGATTEVTRVRRLRVAEVPELTLPSPAGRAPSRAVGAILAAANERAERAYPDAGSSRRTIRLKVHGDLGEVEHDWRAFEPTAVRTAFQSFDWLAKWHEHIGRRRNVTPAIVTGRDGSGRLVLILPLMIERRGLARRLAWLGSDLCDYNAPLLAPEFDRTLRPDAFARLWHDVVRLLGADRRFRFDLIDLAKMPDLIDGQPNPFLALAVSANPSNAYVATLGDDWEAFYRARRSSSTRKTERKQLKRLAEHGEIRFVEPDQSGARARTLATLVAQKRQLLARMGADDMFARPGYLDFYGDVATDPAMADLVHLSRLDVGEATGAASMGLRLAGCYALILSSYQTGALTPFGPGRAHLHELIRRAIANGFTRFDFTIGDEPYKHDWCDVEVKLCDYMVATTARGWPAATATALYRHTKRIIKQTPLLWHAFTKARAMAASLSGRGTPPT